MEKTYYPDSGGKEKINWRKWKGLYKDCTRKRWRDIIYSDWQNKQNYLGPQI